jgi:histidinol dehydrogenase
MNVKIINASQYRRNLLDENESVQETVANILKDIKFNGDASVNDWSLKIDGQAAKIIKLKNFKDYKLDTDLANAIIMAHQRIRKFSQFQMKDLKNDGYIDDVGQFGYSYQPIERIGAYIPGGRFPLVSTALMTLTPAKVAGCKVRIACSPSDHPALLAAASLAGATDFIQVGGAQAIGALSYGFGSFKPVNMIVGPGNTYVNTAKAQVQQRTKIDTLAGPSELLIYANQLQNPEWIVYDALAQAEHDPNAVSIVLSAQKQTLLNLIQICQKSEDGINLVNSKQIQFVYSDTEAGAIKFINEYAPEHLMICCQNFNLKKLKNYGALFIGENSAVAYGDYCSGPNHTLPTSQAAKYSGGLSVHNFVKVVSYQKIRPEGRPALSKISAILAKVEGLENHEKSVRLRN